MQKKLVILTLGLWGLSSFVACITSGPGRGDRHRWWAGLGIVVPHDTFPADCSLCHQGEHWNELRDDFEFDHEKETGTALRGAHAQAACLLCHNDRGPVQVFQARGCSGCHEDVHLGQQGSRCEQCHDETSWNVSWGRELHLNTRFPLVGVHAFTACRACHAGAEVGVFRPTPSECEACHQADLARTTNHLGLGWTRDCHRCHIPTDWRQAEVDPGG